MAELLARWRKRVLRRAGVPAGGGVRTRAVTGADGAPFPVYEQGAGRPILFLHAGSSNWQAWQLVAARLRGRFRLLAFDRRPYRMAPVPAPSLRAEVDDVLAAARDAGEPVLLAGHSSGAVVALEAALADPAAFAGLLLYEPPVAVTEPLGGDALVRARAALDAGDPDRAIVIHAREIVRAPGYLVALQRLAWPLWRRLRSYAAAQIADDEQIESLGVGIDRYAGLDLPALLVGGARSPRHLQERLGALAGVLPRAEVVVLAGQGHLATVFAPGGVAQVVARFADRVWR